MTSKIIFFSFFTLLGFFGVETSEIYLDCYYSKYLLYNLYTKITYFNKITSGNSPDHILIENFALNLQSLGPIVVAMLKKIENEHYDREKEIKSIIDSWSTNAFKNSQGLLSTNFYLNNTANTLFLKTYQDVRIQTEKLDDHKIFINEFKKVYPNLVAQLKNNIINACYVGKQMDLPDIVVRNQYVNRKYSYNMIINNLLPKKKRIEALSMLKNIEHSMSEVSDTEVDLRFHFQVKIEDEILGTNSDDGFNRDNCYHPKTMLFANIFDVNKYKGTLKEITEVPIDEKLINGKYPTMAILFDMIKRTFDVDCVYSFQRQIVAATVYPAYYCVGKFVLLLEKILFGGNDNKVTSRGVSYEKQIKDTATNIISLINTVISIHLPDSVSKHLKDTRERVEVIVDLATDPQKFSKLNIRFVHHVYRRCAKVMQLNLIHFDTGVKEIDKYDEDQCDKIFTKINKKINSAKSALSLVKKEERWTYFYFDVRLQVFSFDDIFVDELSCNIVARNKVGYDIMGKK